MDSFFSLTNDALTLIMVLLDTRSLCNVSQCCQQWYKLATDNLLWKNKITSEYGPSIPLLDTQTTNACRQYYQMLFCNKMFKLTDISPKFNTLYDSLFTDYLLRDQQDEACASPQFFLDLINSKLNPDITRQELIINVAIWMVRITDDDELSRSVNPTYLLMTQHPEANKYLIHATQHPEQLKHCMLIAESFLSDEALNNQRFY